MTEDEKTAAKLLINPTSAIKVADEVFAVHKPASTKEDWVLLNADLVESIGAAAWLDELLDALSLSPEKYDGHDIVNPTLAIAVSETLRTSLSQSVRREEWTQANTKLMNEIGTAEWLWLLLETLENDNK